MKQLIVKFAVVLTLALVLVGVFAVNNPGHASAHTLQRSTTTQAEHPAYDPIYVYPTFVKLWGWYPAYAVYVSHGAVQLAHSEGGNVLVTTLGGFAGLSSKLGPIASYAYAIFTLQSYLMAQVDRGNGVYLTNYGIFAA